MTLLIWLHEDALTLPRHHTPFDHARQIFIWDEKHLTRNFYSLKRRVFLYECLIDVQVEIFQGDRLETLTALSAEHAHLLTVDTPDPAFGALCLKLRDIFELTCLSPTAFVQAQLPPVPPRFFKYWKKARPAALSSGGQLSKSTDD